MRHLDAGDALHASEMGRPKAEDALHASEMRHPEAGDPLHASKVRQTGPGGAILPDRSGACPRRQQGRARRAMAPAPSQTGPPPDSSAGNEMTRDRSWGRCYR
jgi:hypothetical protein